MNNIFFNFVKSQDVVKNQHNICLLQTAASATHHITLNNHWQVGNDNDSHVSKVTTE